MATLSAHGKEIGRIEYVITAKAIMADGTVLVNRGFGWKVHGKFKAGVDPKEAYERRKAALAEWRLKYPKSAAYVDALHKTVGVSLRWKLHAAIGANPQDPDGVWSDVCEDVEIPFDDIAELCRLYLDADQINSTEIQL